MYHYVSDDEMVGHKPALTIGKRANKGTGEEIHNSPSLFNQLFSVVKRSNRDQTKWNIFFFLFCFDQHIVNYFVLFSQTEKQGILYFEIEKYII